MPDMQELIFQLKFSSKQLGKLSRRAEKEEKSQRSKVKKAIQGGNMEGARIYAENAIRKRNESLNYLRMSSKIDAVSSKVQSTFAMNKFTKNMDSVVKALDKAIHSMEMDKVTAVMEQFEQQFEDLDVKTSVVEETMGSSTCTTNPLAQVDNLIQQVAEENGLDIIFQLNQALSVPSGSTSIPTTDRSLEDEEALSCRLAALRT